MKPDNPVYKKRDNRIEIADLISLYRSKWPAFLISIAACLALAVLYIYIKAPVYEIQANILITDDDKTSDLMRSISMADMFVNNTSVDEEMSILNSHSLFRNVTEKLGCNITYTVKNNLIKRTTKYSGSPVKLTPPAGIADTLRSSLKFKLRADKEGLVSVTARNSRNKVVGEVKDKRFPVTLPTPYGDFILSTTDKYEKDRSLSMQIGFCGYDLAAERLQKEVMCYIPNKKADVITVALNSTDINYAKSVVNAIVDQYNARGIEENQRKAQQTADFIDKRLVDISKELNDAESDIEQYKQSHDIVDVEVETKYLLTRKGTLEESLIAAETEVGVLELTRDFIADPANRFNLIPTPLGAEAAAEAIEAYNSLILERIRLEKSAKPGNKVLTALNEQIDAMRSNVATTLERSIASARVTLNELRGKSGDSQSRLGDIPAREREFVNIKRQQAVKENLYLFLLKEREESALRIANAVPKGMIIDKAYALSDQVNMTPAKVLILAFLFGLFIVPLWLYFRSLIRNKISDIRELQRLTTIPILGEVSLDRSGDKMVTAGNSSSSTAELFRLLRSNLQFITGGINAKVLLVTSSTAGEGKSFVAINMAASLTISGKRVVLVGMDIRNPQLTNYLGVASEIGLTTYLSSSQYTVDDITAHHPEVKGLDIITSGPIPPNPSELLMSARVDNLFSELHSRYDYIIIDSAPVGMVSDTYSLARVSDATIYVCRANHTTFSDIEFVNRLYAEKRLPHIALVLNGTHVRKGYGYGYGYGKA